MFILYSFNPLHTQIQKNSWPDRRVSGPAEVGGFCWSECGSTVLREVLAPMDWRGAGDDLVGVTE